LAARWQHYASALEGWAQDETHQQAGIPKIATLIP
jgi:hypothetical protein